MVADNDDELSIEFPEVPTPTPVPRADGGMSSLMDRRRFNTALESSQIPARARSSNVDMGGSVSDSRSLGGTIGGNTIFSGSMNGWKKEDE